MELNDLSFASKLRSILETLARTIIREEAPAPRYGNVIRYNRFINTADVLLQGDPEPVRCTMANGVQPTYAKESFEGATGDVVRVVGKPGSYFIDAIVSSQAFSVNANLFGPTIYSGDFFQVPTIKYDHATSGLPAVGSTWHVGRWNNDTSAFTDAQGMVEIELQWPFFTATTKKYRIGIRPNATNSNWVKVAPILDTGPLNDNECGLEILVDALGFELRIRRIRQGGGFNPAGFDLRLQIWMDNVYKVANSGLGEQASTEPTKFYNCQQDVSYDKGPFLAPLMAAPKIIQDGLMGGGKIAWDGGTLGWNQPFRAIGLGKGWQSKSGYFEISQPPNGQSISVYGKSTLTSVNAGTNGVPLIDNQSLYYEPPWGDVHGSVNTCFRIVDPTDVEFSTPSHWILIAQRTTQTGSASLKLGTGELIDHWREVGSGGNASFSNNWVNFGSGWATAAYKMTDGRCVKFKGLVTGGTANSTVFTLPTEYRPSENHLFATNYFTGSELVGRIAVHSTGAVIVTTGTTGFHSLSMVDYYLS